MGGIVEDAGKDVVGASRIGRRTSGNWSMDFRKVNQL
jgi:hypothetical protein